MNMAMTISTLCPPFKSAQPDAPYFYYRPWILYLEISLNYAMKTNKLHHVE